MRDSGEKLDRYLEFSKDVDQFKMNFDDDDDGETICELEEV